MTIDNKIKDKKLSGSLDKYEYFTGKEILPSDQGRIIEQAKFTCSPLGKVFEKELKTIEGQGTKQLEALKALKSEENQELELIQGLFPKYMRNNETKNEIDDGMKLENGRKKLNEKT